MGTTPVYQLPFPEATEPADVPIDIRELAEAVETRIAPGTAQGQIAVWDHTAKKWVPTTVEVPRTVGAAGQPPFENGWIADAAAEAPRFYKDPLGRVHMMGLCKDGTIGARIFVLPVGYRPAQQVRTVVYSYDGIFKTNTLIIETNGNITTYSVNIQVGLEVSFRAA